MSIILCLVIMCLIKLIMKYIALPDETVLQVIINGCVELGLALLIIFIIKKLQTDEK